MGPGLYARPQSGGTRSPALGGARAHPLLAAAVLRPSSQLTNVVSPAGGGPSIAMAPALPLVSDLLVRSIAPLLAAAHLPGRSLLLGFGGFGAHGIGGGTVGVVLIVGMIGVRMYMRARRGGRGPRGRGPRGGGPWR